MPNPEFFLNRRIFLAFFCVFFILKKSNANNAPTVLSYSSAEVYQSQMPLGIGQTDQRIIRLNVITTGTLSGTNAINSITFNLSGSTNSTSNFDIDNIKIYYTGTDKKFNSTQLYGSATPSSGNITISNTNNLSIGSGNNYFWIVVDVKNVPSIENNNIDATVVSFITKLNGTNTTRTLTAIVGSPAGNSPIILNHVQLFAPGDAGSVSYRIPAIALAGNGDLVTITDKRKTTTADLPNDIDLVMRKSSDKGATWTAPNTIVDYGNASTNGSGDAAIIRNRINNQLIIIYAANQGLWTSTPSNRIEIHKKTSDDNGNTWSAPVNITNQIYGTGCTHATRKNWYAVFTSSGSMLQLSSGRIMALIVVRESSPSIQLSTYAMYSDDGGINWNVSMNVVVPNTTVTGVSTAGDESKVVQLNNGDLLVSGRNRDKGNRIYVKSTDNGSTWGTPYSQPAIQDPAINGEIMRYTKISEGATKNRLLHTIAFDNATRQNVSVMLSEDEGSTWKYNRSIYPGLSAYSTMAILPDGTVGVYYENGEDGQQYYMYYARFSLKFISNGLEAPLNFVVPFSKLDLNVYLYPTDKNRVVVKWNVEGETGVAKYEVETKMPGENEFKKIGERKATNISSAHDYVFNHLPNKKGKIFYRIKIINSDGSIKYSDVRWIDFKKLGFTNQLIIAPNPVKGSTKISVENQTQGTILVFDNEGKKVAEKKFNGFSEMISTENWSAGIYQVQLITTDEKITTQLIKK